MNMLNKLLIAALAATSISTVQAAPPPDDPSAMTFDQMVKQEKSGVKNCKKTQGTIGKIVAARLENGFIVIQSDKSNDGPDGNEGFRKLIGAVTPEQIKSLVGMKTCD